MTLTDKLLSLPIHHFYGVTKAKPEDEWLKRKDVLAILNQYEMVEIKPAQSSPK